MYVRSTVLELVLVANPTSVKKMRVLNILLTGASGLGALAQYPIISTNEQHAIAITCSDASSTSGTRTRLANFVRNWHPLQ